MKRDSAAASVERIEQLIYLIRGQRIMIDFDLARIYRVPTKVLNQAVKRNAERFPEDFMFRLSAEDLEEIGSQISPIGNRTKAVTGSSKTARLTSQIVTSMNRSQIVTGSQKHRNPRYLPYAFTEHGAIMAANVLNSTRAVEMSVFVVRAFVRMRAALADTQELAQRLAELEKEIMERLDVHDVAIVDILRRFMNIIDPPSLPEPPRKQIGFRIKESGRKNKKSLNRRRG